MGDVTYAEFVAEQPTAEREGQADLHRPGPARRPDAAAGVALLEKWYPDSFQFIDKASAQFFEHFTSAPASGCSGSWTATTPSREPRRT